MIPVTIPTQGGACFACYDWAPGRAVLIIPPFGLEAVSSARIWRNFAARLAEHGIAVLRPDLPGTGDSAGSPTDPCQVANWRSAIRAAHAWLAARHGGRVGLMGCRFGALLALDAIGSGIAADCLVLLDPPASGKSFARSLQVRARFEGHGEPPEGPDFIQAYGVPVSTGTLAGISGLPAPIGSRVAPPVLAVIAGTANAWPDRLRESGAEVTVVPFDGHSDFVLQGPMHARAPKAVFDHVLTFLQGMPEAFAAPPPEPSHGLDLPGMTEQPVSFGAGLFGVYCRPDRPLHGAPSVVMPSIGNRPRSGHDQSWTVLARRLARLGIASLRYDAGGVGESAGQAGMLPAVEAYQPQRIADLRAAIDVVSARGCHRVVLVGHCSGAYAAFHGALADIRVAGVLAANMMVLGFQTPASAQARFGHVKLPDASASAMPDAPAPVMPDKSPPTGLCAMVGSLRSSARRQCPDVVWNFVRAMGHEERDARRVLAGLAADGCPVHFLYADAYGEDYRFRRAFGMQPKLPASAELTIVPGADHEFSGRHHRAIFIEAIVGFVMSLADTTVPARQPAEEIAA